MRRPSAYCATSSGMAMTRRLVNTQPDCPVAVRIRLQSSVGAGGFDSGSTSDGGSSDNSAEDCPLERSVVESSAQSAGGAGGFGIGGGGILAAFAAGFFGGALAFFFGGGGISDLRGASVRGVTTCSSTSTFSFSFTCKKLG